MSLLLLHKEGGAANKHADGEERRSCTSVVPRMLWAMRLYFCSSMEVMLGDWISESSDLLPVFDIYSGLQED
eukprot:scaffold275746_cov21-Tisochrysis_lutea.AAC.2